MNHARIAPSSLATIVVCHAHLLLAAPHKDAPPTPESLEGDAAHWVNAQLMTNGVMPQLGTLTPQGLPVDEDMQEGALLWCETVGDGGSSEMQIQIPRIHPTDCFGTPDWWRYDPLADVLRVADYKYGHLFVDAEGCWQLIAYAVGLLDFLGLNDQTTRVELIVVQPRNYRADGPVRRWDCIGSDLRAYVNIAIGAIAESEKPSPIATVGLQCDFCEARHECGTLQGASMRGVSYSSNADRVNLPPAALATELRILDSAAQLIEARRTGLQEQAAALIRGGQYVPGYTVERVLGRLTWTKPADEVFQLGDLMEKDLRKPAAPITPTQAIKAGIDDAVISAYASRFPGKPKLVASSVSQARKIFGANTK